MSELPSPSLITRVVGERVVLRPPRAADVPELRAVLRANAAHLRPWEPAPEPGHDPASLTEVANRTARQRRDWRHGRSYGFLVIARLPGDPIIGRVNFNGVLRGAFCNAYLGYWIAEAHQGQGLMTEAVRAALAFAFESAGLHRVQAAIMPRNERSVRVVEKLGFRREGLAERYLSIAGRWEDHVLFAMTREDWLPSAT